MIPGLTYLPNFISPEMEENLVAAIDNHTWCLDLKRRTQHYGYKYDYAKKKIQDDSFIGLLPGFFNPIIDLLLEQKIIDQKPDQAIVNEYLLNQGIAPHTDCIPCFKEPVISISLLTPCLMDFSGPEEQKEELLLEPRSALILAKDARWTWKHGIKKIHNQAPFRRLSITFRKIK